MVAKKNLNSLPRTAREKTGGIFEPLGGHPRTRRGIYFVCKAKDLKKVLSRLLTRLYVKHQTMYFKTLIERINEQRNWHIDGVNTNLHMVFKEINMKGLKK